MTDSPASAPHADASDSPSGAGGSAHPAMLAWVPDPKAGLLGVLALLTAWYVGVLFKGARSRQASGGDVKPTLPFLGTGFVVNFFDTLGIGSFATTSAIVRQWRLMRDEYLPGTLNAGHAIPTIAQAFIYTRVVPVETKTLVLMIVAAMVGAVFGARIVSSWPVRNIRIGMGLALIGAATLMLLAQLGVAPGGGEALALEGTRLAIGLAGNMVLGALMTIGIGLYGPCLILVSMLGMNPIAAFPIMMGSCAYLMPIGAARFAKAGRVHWPAVIGFAIGGLPAVLLAAFIVKSLPLSAVRWLVVIVVTYTAIGLLRAGLQRTPEADAGGEVPPPLEPQTREA